jgi:predicted MFS family arabinose efflux permease
MDGQATAPGPLRSNRDFQLLWAGQAISVLGSRVSNIAYPLLVLAMTHSPATAGIVGFLGTLPYILLQLPAGAVVDRVNRRRLMMACDIGRLVALGSLPLAAALGRLTLIQIAAAAFVEGSLFVFFRLGEVSAIRIVVDPVQYPQALSQNEARLRAASLAGPPIGGFLFSLGRTLPFLADAFSYLLSLATLLMIRRSFEEQRQTEPRHFWAEIKEGVQWLWGQPYVLFVNLAASAGNLLFQVAVLVVIVAEQQRGASAALIGLVLGGFGLGGLAGSLVGGWLTQRLRPNTIVLTAIWIWPLTAFLGVIGNPVLLVVLLALLAFMGAAWNIASQTVYYRLVPDRLVGRVSSVGALTAFGALPLGALAGGLLVQALGPGAAGAVTGAFMLLLATVTTALPSVRRGPGLD